MNIPIYQVDAFAGKVFAGNPAAICLLNDWLDDDLLQSIAMENNLAETAFVLTVETAYAIRWFTPSIEVDLCGHATLAAAHVLFEHEGHTGNEIVFHSPRSGLLKVYRNGPLLTLDFPVDRFEKVDPTPTLLAVFKDKPVEIFRGKSDLMFVFERESQIRDIHQDFQAISQLSCRGVIATAKGDEVDFVSRWFGPQSGIDEDSVTGSAHTTLTPYWSKRLGKKELEAIQLSKRKGFLKCKDMGERIYISGQAITFLKGMVSI